MGFGYGIKQCRETLLLLANNDDFESRMASAISEIGVIESEDVSTEHYKEINDLRKKYISTSSLKINTDGDLKEVDKEKELQNISDSLVWLCVEIIEHNAKAKPGRNR